VFDDILGKKKPEINLNITTVKIEPKERKLATGWRPLMLPDGTEGICYVEEFEDVPTDILVPKGEFLLIHKKEYDSLRSEINLLKEEIKNDTMIINEADREIESLQELLREAAEVIELQERDILALQMV
jgi:hypothetical protein